MNSHSGRLTRYSTGQTIDFLLSAKRAAAKRFFQKALSSPGNPIPRVINVDKNPAYPAAVQALKAEGTLRRQGWLRQCKYLNNVIEQDHRTVKKRAWLAKVLFRARGELSKELKP